MQRVLLSIGCAFLLLSQKCPFYEILCTLRSQSPACTPKISAFGLCITSLELNSNAAMFISLFAKPFFHDPSIALVRGGGYACPTMQDVSKSSGAEVEHRDGM